MAQRIGNWPCLESVKIPYLELWWKIGIAKKGLSSLKVKIRDNKESITQQEDPSYNSHARKPLNRVKDKSLRNSRAREAYSFSKRLTKFMGSWRLKPTKATTRKISQAKVVYCMHDVWLVEIFFAPKYLNCTF